MHDGIERRRLGMHAYTECNRVIVLFIMLFHDDPRCGMYIVHTKMLSWTYEWSHPIRSKENRK